ncbi:hypothetical protein GDO81_004249 [Engystomops pustulosus]|uniref:Serpentine receptor class gamma n=1 Tax=Engystomops pustulosus TaxID=76066 RepID=A0AAV6ZX02_ENGPU|nr:hypothetical protein GDO81_004249 [Engystomops pustulosus]
MEAVTITLVSINYVTLILQFPGNAFIIVVLILDFYKNRRLPVNDQLILVLNVFNLLYGFNAGYLLYGYLSKLNDYGLFDQAIHHFMFSNLCSIVFSALLSIHFCLKIVNINNRFYIGLQKRFPNLFPWIIIAFPVGYFLLSHFSAAGRIKHCLLNTTSEFEYMEESLRCSWIAVFFVIICVTCTFSCTVSALTILISLFRHVKRMQENTRGSPNTASSSSLPNSIQTENDPSSAGMG